MIHFERLTEPKDAPVLLSCECCGVDICKGDEYYYLPENPLHDYLCEDCARAWLDRHKETAGRE